MPRYRTAADMPFIAPPVVIDIAAIPPDDLAMELGNAAKDPDGQVFPWRDLYPLAGSTVYLAGELWMPYAREPMDPLRGSCYELVRLSGVGRDARMVARRCDLRPVTWTQQDEDALQERQRCRFVVPNPLTYVGQHGGDA